MTTIQIKDQLRQSVELASGGAQTVLYTTKGQPSVMNIIPRQTIGDLYPTVYPGDTTIHPAFQVGDKTLSQLFIGTYWGAIKNGELVSQIGNSTAGVMTVQQAVDAAKSSGTGHHMMNWSEKALINALCNKAGFSPFAANGYGLSDDGTMSAIRVDGKKPGDTSSTSGVLSGSGPVGFRHDNTYTGISDLYMNGLNNSAGGPNIVGIRIFYGELQFLAGNSAAAVTDATVFGKASVDAQWKALDGTTGLFVTPTFAKDSQTQAITPTTTNSVRVLKSGTSSVYGMTTALPANSLSNAGAWWNSDSANYNLSLQALKVIRMYGLVMYGSESAYIKKPNNTDVGTLFFDDTSKGVYTKATFNDVNAIFGYAWTDGTDIVSYNGQVRPCYYSTLDLA